MSEMVDRVALALSRSSLDGYLEGYKHKSVNTMNPEELAIARRNARAAIEAMREPTEVMVAAARQSAPFDRDVEETWPLMIDAALKDA